MARSHLFYIGFPATSQLSGSAPIIHAGGRAAAGISAFEGFEPYAAAIVADAQHSGAAALLPEGLPFLDLAG